MDELCYLPATEALRLFRERSLSPVELVSAVIARAEATEPALNALCVRYFDEAMDQARLATERYGGRSGRPRPLEGLPVAIKEETPVADQRTTQGSLIYEHDVSEYSAVVADRVIAAGAIVHARSTAPEFSCAPFTHSRLWGVTHNPWNLQFNPGGSSGGSAASLAAGSTTLATGSDIGGSIRIPASACGVVGFKPPYGRVPESPPFNLDHYCHEGPLARTVADCALLENVMAGPHPSDVASLRPKLRLPQGFGGIIGWRIALSIDLGDFPVDEDVVSNTIAAADALREAGAIVEEVELPWRRAELLEAAQIHFASIFAGVIREEVEHHRELMTSYALAFADDLVPISGESYLRGLGIESRTYAALGALLTRYRILVCPTLAIPALDAADDYVGHGPEVNGVRQSSAWDVTMTYPFNICSRCPVMSVPSGFARNGVPTGLQIVGRTYDDVSVFRTASAFEAVRPWLDSNEHRPTLG